MYSLIRLLCYLLSYFFIIYHELNQCLAIEANKLNQIDVTVNVT